MHPGVRSYVTAKPTVNCVEAESCGYETNAHRCEGYQERWPTAVYVLRRLPAHQPQRPAARSGSIVPPPPCRDQSVSGAEDLPRVVGLPRGRRTELEALFSQHGVSLDVEDQRISGEPVGFRFQGELTPVQQKAAAALLEHDIGVFVAPPGIGKTVVGTNIVAKRQLEHADLGPPPSARRSVAGVAFALPRH